MAQWIASGFGHENRVGARSEECFGLVVDTDHAESVLIEKHGRGVVVVVSVEEHERLSVRSGRTDKGKRGTEARREL